MVPLIIDKLAMYIETKLLDYNNCRNLTPKYKILKNLTKVIFVTIAMMP